MFQFLISRLLISLSIYIIIRYKHFLQIKECAKKSIISQFLRNRKINTHIQICPMHPNNFPSSSRATIKYYPFSKLLSLDSQIQIESFKIKTLQKVELALHIIKQDQNLILLIYHAIRNA